MPNGLYEVCSSIATGSIPPLVALLMSSAKLLALRKTNGDVQPVAIGEARVICDMKKNKFQEFFCPIQHGVATGRGRTFDTTYSTIVVFAR